MLPAAMALTAGARQLQRAVAHTHTHTGKNSVYGVFNAPGVAVIVLRDGAGAVYPLDFQQIMIDLYHTMRGALQWC